MSKVDRVLLSTYLRPQLPRVLLLGILLFTGIGLQLANPQIARTFIDRAQAGDPFEHLVRIALLFIVVALLSQASTVLETYVADDLGWRTTNALRTDLTRHVLDLDGSFHDEHGAGELIERIDGDVAAIAEFFARFVVHVLGSVAFLLGVLVLLYAVDPRVGALLTVFAVGAFVFMTRGGGFVRLRSRADREAAADLSAYLEERLGGLRDIKASGADAYAMLRLHERIAARFHRGRASVLAGSVFYGTVGLFFVFGTGAALALSAGLVRGGTITLGAVYVVFRYTSMLRVPLERLSNQMSSFQRATGAIGRVRELLATEREVVDGRGVALPDGALSVELDEVSFAYGEDPVLRGVSCAVEPGEVLGLLGRTGSGKTTVSRLLFRLHDVTAGAVRLGGVDVRDARVDAVRGRVALVTQDVQLFGGTLRDNVAMFDDTVTDARLTDVFAGLALGGWLDALPEGLDTPLGPGGRGLSAGEAQLVALARVFLRDPGLVVLDEASARLDPATERLVERAITRLLEGRTGVVIAHRLTTVARANRILVLSDGRVAEYGPRDDLARDPTSRFSQLLRMGMEEVLS